MKAAVFPRLPVGNGQYGNPYIQDFVKALEGCGITVVNPPHKNPLLSILHLRPMPEAYIFHWIEDIPSAPHGFLQTCAAVWLILRAKAGKRKVVWFFHNKRPHGEAHGRMKKLMSRFIVKRADLIVTHAREGLEVIRRQRPQSAARAVFLHHPTKNRISFRGAPSAPETDLLVWGTISPYKKVLELVRFAVLRHWGLRIKIIGKCDLEQMREELEEAAKESPCITFENRGIPFAELEAEIRKSKFVLVPYAQESVLSSAVLMDSLSFGARVIGPDAGSFKDYAQEPQVGVYTFGTFSGIPAVVSREYRPLDIGNYKAFLDSHSWNAFGEAFSQLLRRLAAGSPMSAAPRAGGDAAAADRAAAVLQCGFPEKQIFPPVWKQGFQRS